MLPYGKKDRPNYPGASRVRAKEYCGLVPFDFPSFGLRASWEGYGWGLIYAAAPSLLISTWMRLGS